MKKIVEGTIIFNLSIPGKLLKRIDDYRFEQRFDTRAHAMRYLMAWALNQLHKPNDES